MEVNGGVVHLVIFSLVPPPLQSHHSGSEDSDGVSSVVNPGFEELQRKGRFSLTQVATTDIIGLDKATGLGVEVDGEENKDIADNNKSENNIDTLLEV